MWYMGVLVKLLGLLLLIYFLLSLYLSTFSQVGDFNSLPPSNEPVRCLQTTWKQYLDARFLSRLLCLLGVRGVTLTLAL